jgi:formylglycine-generating enzyme required for sulfatase activity
MPGRCVLWFFCLLSLPSPAIAQGPARTGAELLKTSIGMNLKRIPAGTFLMGSDPQEVILLDTKPQHTVKITRAFYLGLYEVTQLEYQQIMGKNPSRFRSADRLPVEQVSWLDAATFCNKLSERERRNPYYRIEGERVRVLAGDGFRLPTEAEWEYACRAGTTTRFPTDGNDTKLGSYAWFEGNSAAKTRKVGEKRPNRFGLYDMLGNVFEWCGDWFDVDFYKNSPATDPIGASRSELRVIRGCAWNTNAVLVRSAYRNRGLPLDRYDYIGFRVAATSEEPGRG